MSSAVRDYEGLPISIARRRLLNAVRVDLEEMTLLPDTLMEDPSSGPQPTGASP